MSKLIEQKSGKYRFQTEEITIVEKEFTFTQLQERKAALSVRLVEAKKYLDKLDSELKEVTALLELTNVKTV